MNFNVMKVFFLGSFFPIELESSIRQKSKGPIANANNALQWSYLKGLESFYPSLEVITLPQIGAFPLRYKSLLFRTKLSKFIINRNTIAYCINFFNLVLIKHLHRYIKAKSILTKLLAHVTDSRILIIVYDLSAPFLNAAKKVKEIHRNVTICVIVPDLLFMTGSPDNILHRMFHNAENIFVNKSFDSIDLFVLLSRHMVDKLPVKNRPWIVIEGIFNANIELIEHEENPGTNDMIVFYSGAIDERNGIKNLVEAFKLIQDPKYRLVICGDGEERKNVLEAAKKDKRIIFKGQISRNEVMKLQKEATLLVNPRSSYSEFTKYSFPSKTLEYFASGVPVLMFEIEGIPTEYYSFCYTIKENTVIALKDMILRICEQDPIVLKTMGNHARKFILENKGPIQQCSRLVKFINENTPSN